MPLEVRQLELSATTPDGDRRRIFHDFGFTLERGQTLALTGPSGCGKTMTALAIMDLLPAGLQRVAGRILIDGLAMNRAMRGRKVGMIFQEPRLAMNPAFSVGDQLRDVFVAKGGQGAQARTVVLQALLDVGLADPQDRLPDFAWQFSGGELQRIMIAMALMGEPAYLIADEATSNLDVLTQGKILALLRRLGRDRNLGILLVTHDRRVVAAMADKEVSLSALDPEPHP